MRQLSFNDNGVNNTRAKNSFEISAPGTDKHILFYIEIFEESSAYYLAARLQKENWEINVIPAGSCWICMAHAVAKPDHKTINDLCDYLSDLSEFYDGCFQKWELGSSS